MTVSYESTLGNFLRRLAPFHLLGRPIVATDPADHPDLRDRNSSQASDVPTI